MIPNHWTPGALPHSLTTALSGQITVMPKQSNRERLVQEHLKDEKMIKKRRFLWKKRRMKRQKKTTKKQSFLTIKRGLEQWKLMKTKKTTTKRRKVRFLTKCCFFFVVVLNTGMCALNWVWWELFLVVGLSLGDQPCFIIFPVRSMKFRFNEWPWA